MKLFLLFLLLSGQMEAGEEAEEIKNYKGEARGFLTFSEHFPLEMDDANKKVAKKQEGEAFKRNVKIEEGKSLPWDKFFLGLLAAVTFVALRYSPRQHQKKSLENPKTVQEEAVLELKELKLKNLGNEEYYSELSSILRTFIERRYGIHAPKQTTEEFLETVNMHEEFFPLKEKVLEQFLSLSDLVKFSRAKSTAEEQTKAYETALKIIMGDG